MTGHEETITDAGCLANVVLPYRDWLLDLPPKTGDDQIYKVILIVFPKLHDLEGFKMIDQAQAILKPAFVPKGLMVGQFHPCCDEPGVRSAEFRPLRCPVPMIAIQFMTKHDLPFLTARDHFREYKTRFQNVVPERLEPLFRQVMEREI